MKQRSILHHTLPAFFFAALLALTSCGKEEAVETPSDAIRHFDLAASVTGGFTRSDGEEPVTADRCILEIYNADGTPYDHKRTVVTFGDDGTCSFQPKVLSGRSYRFVLWADKAGATPDDDLHYITSDGLRHISVNPQTFALCNAELDAYCAVIEVSDDTPPTLSALLRRAVCLLNVSSGHVPGRSGESRVDVTFSRVGTTIDALTGAVGGFGTLTGSATVPVGTADEAVAWYAYLPAPAEADACSIDFEMTATWSDGSVPDFHDTFTDIPLRRNYRVNLSKTAQP